MDFTDLLDINEDALPFGSWNVNEVADRIEKPTWRNRLRMATHRTTAAAVLRQLWHAGDEIMQKLVTVQGAMEIMQDDHKKQISALIREQVLAVEETKRLAQQVAGRIDIALDDFNRAQAATNYSRREEPFGIILSPYQFERMRWAHGFNSGATGDDKDRRRTREYKNIRVYTAKGMSGPLVVSKAAFDGLSRQAPELLLVSK